MSQGQLEREGYGGSLKEEQLVVSGLGTEEQTVTVKVSPRVYTREEADEVFFEIMDSLEEEIRGKNESLQAVSENLKLPSYLDEYGVRVRWHSSEPELLSSAGTIEAGIEKKQEVVLQAELSAGEYRADFELPVTLVPKKLTEEELLRKHFSKEVNRLDEQQKQLSSLQLPMEYQGKALSYRSAEKNRTFADRGKVKIKAMGKDGIQMNRETIELRYVEQIVDAEQTNVLGYLVKYAEQNLFDGKKTIQQVVDAMEQKMERDGLASIAESSYLPVNFAMPRKQEIFACLNRYRGLRL